MVASVAKSHIKLVLRISSKHQVPDVEHLALKRTLGVDIWLCAIAATQFIGSIVTQKICIFRICVELRDPEVEHLIAMRVAKSMSVSQVEGHSVRSERFEADES